jgi:ketosteroid isomerase-like protein
MPDVVARYHRAMVDKSADELAALYAESAVHEFPFTTPGFPTRFEGRDAIRAAYGALWRSSPALVERIEDVVVHAGTDPDVLIVEQTAVGTVGPGGPPFRLPSLLILRISDGLIVHCRDYLDGLGIVNLTS